MVGATSMGSANSATRRCSHRGLLERLSGNLGNCPKNQKLSALFEDE